MLNIIGALLSKYGLQSVNLILLVILIWAMVGLLKNHLTRISQKLNKQDKKIKVLCKESKEMGKEIAYLEGRMGICKKKKNGN